VPKRAFLGDRGDGLSIVAGDTSAWLARTDAALVGKTLADRRGLRPGDTFDAAGITTHVAAIFDANNPGDQNVAYTALEFVQLAGRDELGIVTQFEVEVTDAGQLEPVAAAIDELFAVAQEPTQTYTVQAFVGRVAGDVIELVNFAGWLGLGCLAAVLALVGNAIVLGVQSRVAEHAVLQTLGYTGRSIAVLIVGEGVLLALIGGLVGGLAAVVVADFGALALSVDGQSILIRATPGLVLVGLVTCGALGVVAGLVPAWQASRRPIAACFRTT
ncbi:MAG: FtsX-like permease family protein, partial [Planctomycetota bacterium]